MINNTDFIRKNNPCPMGVLGSAIMPKYTPKLGMGSNRIKDISALRVCKFIIKSPSNIQKQVTHPVFDEKKPFFHPLLKPHIA
tara:strand:- start:64 stop:312 length:249 start_codon:yes stop_codon:yes gene_type:complete